MIAPVPRTTRLLRWPAVILVATGGLLLADGVRIRAKAAVAQVLLRSAWARTDTDAARVVPWPWADTWPVARLVVARLDVDQIVLADAGGESLAFGPSHVAGSAVPGADGITVLGGHRDTHFDWLERLVVGDVLVLETPGGRRHAYRAAAVATAPAVDVELRVQGCDRALVLVTCRAPRAARRNSRPRYLVTAHSLDGGA